MNRDDLIRHLEKRYTSKHGMLSRIPLSIQPDPLWRDILNQRRSRGTILPLYSHSGTPYWFVTTDKMITASEKIIETLYENETEFDPYTDLLPVSTLEEIYYTSYVEGSQITIQAAMDYLTSEQPPRDIEEQLITNNRAAASYASKNMFRKIDTDYLQELIFILTDGMDYGGSDFRSIDTVDFTLMADESYHFPPAQQIPTRMTELTHFLADPTAHPLIKSAVAQAWMVIVQPFTEGNERLGRILSSIILLRAGYTFFSEVSLSSLISRKSYGYYESIANILREENGFDLTYFIEYFLELLSRAIDERKLRQNKREEENRQAEIAMAHMPLVPVPHSPQKEELQDSFEHNDKGSVVTDVDSFTDLPPVDKIEDPESLSHPPGLQEVSVENKSESLREELNESGSKVETDQSTQLTPIEHLIECSKRQEKLTGKLSLFIMKRIKEGKLYFWTNEAVNDLNVTTPQQLSSSFRYMCDYGILMMKERKKHQTLYKITIGNRSTTETIDSTDTNNYSDITEIENRNIEIAKEQGYDSSVLDLILKLKNASVSIKEKRLGSMLALCILSGEITITDYENHGHPTRWNVDMFLASQLGIVERVDSQKCIILQKLKEGPVALSSAQKRMVTKIYESFGEDFFSTEMVAAIFNYTCPHVSACLHQFTLLKILDCHKENVNKYQFLITPEDYPEYFIQVA